MFQISAETENFELLDQINPKKSVSNLPTNNCHFFGPNLPKKSISGRKRKSEHHHWILLIRIGLGSKLKFKVTILKVRKNFKYL